MKSFSLSRDGQLPTAVLANGREYPIESGFREILRIFRMLDDPEIREEDRRWLMLRMFFKEDVPPKPDEGFSWFVSCGREKDAEPGGERDFDYEQDAMELYSAFRQVYGIDLLEENLHWWKFSALLAGVFVSSNALSNKIELRHLDDGKAQRALAREKAKRNVRLRTAVSRTEQTLTEQIQARLIAGQDIGDLIGR